MVKESFDEAIAFATCLNRVSALRNFRDPKKNKVKFVMSWIYDIVMLAFFCSILCFSELSNLLRMPFNMERMMYMITLIIFLLGYGTALCIGLYHSKRELLLRKELNIVDEHLKKLGAVVEYHSIYRRTMTLTISGIMHVLIIIALYLQFWLLSNITLPTIISFVAYTYGMYVGSLVLINFDIFVYWMELRFKATNQLLKEFLSESRQVKSQTADKDDIAEVMNDFQGRFRPSKRLSDRPLRDATLSNVSRSMKKVHFLQQIRFVHLKLCGVAKVLNGISDTQIILHVLVTLIYLTITLYYLYMEMQYRLDHFIENIILIVTFLLDCVLNTANIVIVSISCEHTTSEANETIQIIHACPLYRIDTELKEEIIQFSLQISHTQLGKSKFTSFRLNHGFLRQCLSFIATYLVISIQWSQGSDTERNVINANETYLSEQQLSTTLRNTMVQ